MTFCLDARSMPQLSRAMPPSDTVPVVHDPARLDALASYAILDTPAEEGFDDIVQLASQLCDAPVALVSFVASERVWFKARVGFAACEADLDSSVCTHALEATDLLVIGDLKQDARTSSLPVVTEPPGIRFYAGAPLRTTDGKVLGSLCVIDETPRPHGLTAKQADGLRALARQVMSQLELRRAMKGRDALLRTVAEGETRYRSIFESAIDFAIIATDGDGLVSDWNTGATRILGWSAAELRGRSAACIFTPEDRAAGRVEREMELALERGRANDERWHQRKDGTRFWAAGELMPLRDGRRTLGFLKILRDRTESRNADRRAAAVERALAVSEERQRLAADATGIGIFDFMVESGELTWDARVRALFGVGPEDPVSYESSFLGGLHPDDREVSDDAVQRALAPAGSRIFDISYRVRPHDGADERWLAARGQALVEDGRAVRFVGTVRDITAQKHAELALVTTQERYKLVTRATNDAIWDWDLGGNHIRWNDALTAAYGHDLAVVAPTGEWWIAHIHPDDRDRIAHSIHAVIDHSGTAWTERYRFLRRDGSYADVIDRGYVIRDAAGRATRMVGAMLDVTEINAAARHQAALLEFGDRTRDLVDPATISFAACALLAATLDVDLVGYGTVDAEAETITVERDWTAPGIGSLAGTLQFRDYGSYIEDLKRATTVVVCDAETDARTRVHAEALKARCAQAFVNLPIFEQGRFVALLYVSQRAARMWSEGDVALVREFAMRTRIAAERARAEKEQRRQAIKLTSLNATLEQQVAERTRDRDRIWRLSTDVMVVARFDAIIVSVNPAWTSLLGWTEDELIGRSFMDLVHPEDGAATLAAAGNVSSGSILPRFENRYRHKDGSYRWLTWTAVPDDLFIHAIGRDFTAEKEQAEALAKTEDALRQSQKMEAVGQLTGGIAHDFNNLLTGITGSLELLGTRIAQGRLNDVERYTTAAQGAARRAAALTHRLLAFSRRQTLDPKPTDANRLVAGMEDLIRRTVGPANAIEVVAAGGLWTTLVDPPQLENALLNLCINARDAMPDGGRITIETANKWLDSRAAAERDVDPGQYISLCVSDTGSGMPPDVIAKAFEPFFTTKPIGQGTGLGLSMIYGFVRQSGGQVRIYSEVGQGTNVCLYLPRYVGSEGVAEEARDLADAPRAVSGETVLVVDDEPTVRMLVTEVLEELGYAAIEAADGASGLKVLQSDVRIDLLITDVGLPGGMNGRQMADAARAGRPGLTTLFITGYAENAVVGNGHLEPGMHVLTKPFAMEALAARIKELIVGG